MILPMLFQLPQIFVFAWNNSSVLSPNLLSPKIKIDLPLYGKLIKKCPTGEVDPNADPPEVQFTNGPIDGVLGSFNNETKTITIDALEIMMDVLSSGKVNSREDFIREYDHEITRVMAHEGGHWHLDKRYGKWAMAEKVAIFTAIMVIGMVLPMMEFAQLFVKGSDFIYSLALPIPWIIALLVKGVSYVLLGATEFKVIRTLSHVWSIACFKISYKLCLHERFARKFEEQCDDPQWENVAVVEA